MTSLLHYLTTTLTNGRKAWFVVQLENPIKQRLLEGHIKQNTGYNLADMGEVLYAGYGDGASQALLDEINATHGTAFAA